MNQTEEKVQETIQELNEWLKAPDAENERYKTVMDEINEKLNSAKVPKSILNRFVDLNVWYSNNFIYEILTADISDYKSKVSASGYHILIAADFLAKEYPQNPPYLLFDQVGRWLATCLSTKWNKESKDMVEVINKGLKSFLKGGLNFKPTAWFIVAIANKGYNIYVDYNNYNYPSAMGIYQEALDNWDTNDLGKLDNIISGLCDFHLKNATYGTDQEDTANIQFGDSSEFVYAYEILAWLSIREMEGLKNPDTFTHPLMNLKLNQLPKETAAVPQEPLFDRVLEKLKT
jgi:hypothetical protein